MDGISLRLSFRALRNEGLVVGASKVGRGVREVAHINIDEDAIK